VPSNDSPASAGVPGTEILWLCLEYFLGTYSCRPTSDSFLKVAFVSMSPLVGSTRVLQGYITRLRGYYANNRQVPGYRQGHVSTWFYVLDVGDSDFEQMRRYYPVKQPTWGREFPTSWRLLDMDVAD
jgi:hypothetical protein